MKDTFLKRLACGTLLAIALPLAAQTADPSSSALVTTTDPADIALLPQQNACRNLLSLSGLWSFQVDSLHVGQAEGWQQGLPDGQPIAVPGSWNEQIAGLKGYLGTAWYQTTVTPPAAWQGQRVFLRVGSALYYARVYLNDELVGSHEGGSTPFAIELTAALKYGQANRISIEIENHLAPTRIPTGMLSAVGRQYPNASYDFFPYGGLQRDVTLYTVPAQASMSDLTIVPSFEGTTGRLDLTVACVGSASSVRIAVSAPGKKTVTAKAKVAGDKAQVAVKLPDVSLWSPDSPFLYEVSVELCDNTDVVDTYTTYTGVRTISVSDGQILLNDQPIRLRGFGKHEDFPIFGRGKALPVTVKDFQLLKWCGANAFRTSHYPYDESVYEMADRLGILLIDETPAVGLIFYDGADNVATRGAVCERMLQEMISRDKNHPSVILWSVANEPSPKTIGGSSYTGLEQEGESEENRVARAFLGGLLDRARELDPTRPATFAAMSGAPFTWMEGCDVVCINRYYGWYSQPGDMPSALRYLSGDLDRLWSMYHKPVVMTEFGADAVAGEHSEYREMFTEEFQADFIRSYLDVANTKDYVAGMMIWNFADFHTAQAMYRVKAMNLKGVFTIDRRPKMAAYLLHERWTGSDRY